MYKAMPGCILDKMSPLPNPPPRIFIMRIANCLTVGEGEYLEFDVNEVQSHLIHIKFKALCYMLEQQ